MLYALPYYTSYNITLSIANSKIFRKEQNRLFFQAVFKEINIFIARNGLNSATLISVFF